MAGNSKHWLSRTHTAMRRAGYHSLWLPGSTTWRHYTPGWPTKESEREAIRRAQRQGYLSAGKGIPYLTLRGYQRY